MDKLADCNNDINSKISGVSFTKVVADANTAKAITLPNNYRGVFFTVASTSAANGEYLVFATGAGVVTTNTVKDASALSISTTTNTITITPTAQTHIVFINFSGTATA